MDSCDIPKFMIRYRIRELLVQQYRTHLKVAEKRVYEEIKNDKRRENGIKNTHENESPSQSVLGSEWQLKYDQSNSTVGTLTPAQDPSSFSLSQTLSEPVPFYQTNNPINKSANSIQELWSSDSRQSLGTFSRVRTEVTVEGDQPIR